MSCQFQLILFLLSCHYVDLEAIEELVDNVDRGNYPDQVIFNRELPHCALGGLIGGQLSVEETAELLYCHQATRDFSHLRAKIGRIFGSTGHWSQEMEEILKKPTWQPGYSVFGEWVNLTEWYLRTALRVLPVSQQVFLAFPGLVSGLQERELSLEAQRVWLHVRTKHQVLKEHRLGRFSKDDIATALIRYGSRLLYSPFPGIRVDRESLDRHDFDFARHDRLHWRVIYRIPTATFNAMREILIVLRKTTKHLMSDEIWQITDFVYPIYRRLGLEDPASRHLGGALKYVLEKCPEGDDLWEWLIVLHIRAHRERWQMQYGISIGDVDLLKDKNALADLAQPYLLNRTMLEQIYFLQRLVKSGEEMGDFFQKQLANPTPRLTVERANTGGKKDGGTLRLEVRP